MKCFHVLPIHPEQVWENISYLSAIFSIADLLTISYTFHTHELDHLNPFRLNQSYLGCLCYLFDVYKLEVLSVCLLHTYHIQYHIYYV